MIMGSAVCNFRAVGFFLAVICLPGSSQAYNMLFMSLLGGPGSHFYTGTIIAETLVQRGHRVTFVISDVFGYQANSSLAKLFDFEVYPSTIPRSQMRENLAALGSSSLRGERSSSWDWLKMWVYGGTKGASTGPAIGVNTFFAGECDSALSDSAMMDRLRAAQFDIVVGDVLYPCFILIAQKLNLRYVNVMNGVIMPMAHSRLAGMPNNPAFLPGAMTTLTDNMNVLQRCLNVFAYAVNAFLYDTFYLGPFDRLKTKHGIQSEMSMYESLGRAEVWLMNTDFTTDYPRSLTPNVVLVGGLTTTPAKPLDKDLESFMDGSGEHGVILFTLSSHFSSLDANRSNELAAVFARLPQRVVWKYEGEPPASLGNNSKLVNWLPLNDLLGHPKTRALISHCGLNGVYEAIYHGVPVIGIPLLGDQFDIIARIQPRGFAKQVDINTLTGDIFYEAIVEVLQDKRYKESALKWSRIFHDQPNTPRERAANWVELVTKYGGSYLRPKSLDLNFFQLHSIDVLVFLGVVAVLAAYIAFYFTRMICRLICCRSKAGRKKEKNE
ncbi:UDP-glucuronosyltransferase 2C1-like [Acanthaster planci]|uniref:UDP-glucuronosyltransferase 2C1-like n=1 Tax=Acanthaster planci TaxID=133434 RepID=A0A8B7YTZ6_ACAPL|nr:UDP-glucuronosyltransferase 2C1-like [Acanthaster planci]